MWNVDVRQLASQVALTRALLRSSDPHVIALSTGALLDPPLRTAFSSMFVPGAIPHVDAALRSVPRGTALSTWLIALGLEDPQKLLAAAAIVSAYMALDEAGGGSLLQLLSGVDPADDVADDHERPTGLALNLQVAHALLKPCALLESGLEDVSSAGNQVLEALDPFLPGNQGGALSKSTSVLDLIRGLIP